MPILSDPPPGAPAPDRAPPRGGGAAGRRQPGADGRRTGRHCGSDRSGRAPDLEGAIALPRAQSRRAPTPWTEERIGRLKALWLQGVSARQIARELGRGLSRNAVLGKIHRLGIADLSPYRGTRDKRAAEAERRGRARPAIAVDARDRHFRMQRSLPTWVIEAKPYVDDPRADAGIPRAQRRRFLDLGEQTCRWPVGDPERAEFFFCGGDQLPGRPYCAAHCARAVRSNAQRDAARNAARNAVIEDKEAENGKE